MMPISGLYLVTDRGLCGARSLEEVVRAALKGGATCVQLREKDVTTRFFLEEAGRLKKILSDFGAPLIINDRLDVAQAIGADGVHIGQDDMPYETARRLMGPKAIIGLSVESWEDVERARDLDVDYLGVSPIFETLTKTDTKGSWGLEGLARIRAYTRLPLVAIGGLNASNAEAAVLAGADSIAVVSAICAAADPLKASHDLLGIIRSAMAKRSS
jgi:thiamine-phosphate pyrophosphorylase